MANFKNVAVIACLKTFLFVFNVIFWVTSLMTFSTVVWAEFDLHMYMELSPEFSGTALHVMFGISGLIFLISTYAFSCMIKGQPVLLYTYGGFLACIFMMEMGVAASIACYRDTFGKALYEGLTTTFKNNKNRAKFDFTQSTLKCCGVSNYTDWIRSSPQKVIPYSCCVDIDHCITANYNDVYPRGCYDVIVEYLVSNMNLLIGVAVSTALLPLTGSVLSCSLASYIKKSKYDVIN